jgi:hypothetical protein
MGIEYLPVNTPFQSVSRKDRRAWLPNLRIGTPLIQLNWFQGF